MRPGIAIIAPARKTRPASPTSRPTCCALACPGITVTPSACTGRSDRAAAKPARRITAEPRITSTATARSTPAQPMIPASQDATNHSATT